jgi:hypothetical protein
MHRRRSTRDLPGQPLAMYTTMTCPARLLCPAACRPAALLPCCPAALLPCCPAALLPVCTPLAGRMAGPWSASHGPGLPRLAGPSTCFRSRPAMLLHNPRSPPLTTHQPGPRRCRHSWSAASSPRRLHDSPVPLWPTPPCLPRRPPPSCRCVYLTPSSHLTPQTPAKPDNDPNLLHYLLK